MNGSAAFALPVLLRFGVGFLGLGLKDKELFQSEPSFDDRAPVSVTIDRAWNIRHYRTRSRIPGGELFLIFTTRLAIEPLAGLSAHANAAITYDVNVSFQRDRRIVCFPGDA
jgi:hypothetical protein